jgi:signal transduction histidine kinase
MPVRHSRCFESRCWVVSLALVFWAAVSTSTVFGQAITNLHQLTVALSAVQRTNLEVNIEATVCAASRPKVGVLIAQDETGTELLQVGDFKKDIPPGEQIRIRCDACWLRKREMGVELSAPLVVDNDGLHSWRTKGGEVTLAAGKIPLRLEWFNYRWSFALDASWAITNEPPQPIAASNLWHAVVGEPGATSFLPGLRAECYEGLWESLPDFNLLSPVKDGVVTNFDLGFRSRDELVGIRYSGFLEVPRAGRYRLEVGSDDGALLFLGDPSVPVVRLGHTNVPTPKRSRLLGGGFSSLDARRWTTVEGRVSFVSRIGEGVKFDLGLDRYVISVRIADATGLDLAALVNSRVRVTGIGRGVMTADQTLALGQLFAASSKDLVFVEAAFGQAESRLPITSVAQVRSLPVERARQALPVRLRGTVTGAIKSSQEHWMSFQDDTRGIFVRLNSITNAAPAFGELWEVEGHSGAGDFAPIVVADQVTRLGEGLLPTPVSPTWAELLNGSRDVQWAELKGLVTDVRSNTLSLQLPEGRLDIELESCFESELKPFLKSVVSIRGVLYAVWSGATREVQVGKVMMRSSSICVDVPAPDDPFDAVLKKPRELLLFDEQATAFRRVKVRGQIIYADPSQLFLEEDGTGVRLVPMAKTAARPGDLVEAVGYPDIGKTELLLREAQLRKIGAAPLPAATMLDESGQPQQNLNATRVHVEGNLLGWHVEQGRPVLEMQSGARSYPYLAQVALGKSSPPALRLGSRLALEGVYVGNARNQGYNTDNESFELLLNSPADITVLSQPSWWTLPRLLILIGVLMVVLIFTVIWNTQLRRLVEQRTHQLQNEIQERERVEHQHALEAERSRIARDLHDDLGSSLTEISVLASTGQLPQTSATHQPNLFQAIGAKARSLVSALDVIVWAVDPEDNSLQSLADYLSGYTADFFSHTDIDCRFKVPMAFPPINIEGRVRHDLLMVVKEALNNIVRHADATEVEFRLAMADGGLEIDIADNGKGIDKEMPSQGHGLKNFSARLQKLGGRCVIEPCAWNGTNVKIRLPLAAAAAAGRDETERR